MKCPKCGYESEFRKQIEAQNKRLREWAEKVCKRAKRWW